MSKELEKSIKWLSNVNNFENVSRYSKEYFEHFNKVVKALTPPTEQEVCKVLSEETGDSVYYENGKFYVHSVLWRYALSLDTLSKKSISLIGRFYEGEIK